MKHIKDFLYNWNDIVVILIILAAAAGLIYWRVNNIMDYPRVLASEVSEGTLDGMDIPMPEEAPAAETAEEAATGDTEPGAGPKDSEIWTKSRLYSNLDVEIPEGAETDMVEVLVTRGIFASYDDFIAVCEKTNVDHTKIAPGKYTFTAGSTQQDIVKQITVRETPTEAAAEKPKEEQPAEATEETAEETAEAPVEETSGEEYVEEYSEDTGEEWVEEETFEDGGE